MDKFKKLVPVLSLAFVLFVTGITLASPNGPGRLADIIRNPLNSTIKTSTELDSCVNKIISFAQATYPSNKEITVFMKNQNTKTIILKGNFEHPRSHRHLPFIKFIVTGYPECYPETTTFDVKGYGLRNDAK